MRVLFATAAFLALSASAFAQTPAPQEQEETPIAFTVIESDVSVPFASVRIRDYEIGRDNSLILRAGANRWYRATIWEPCASDLRWAYDRIGLDTHPGGALDKFSTVIVRGRRCPIRTLDRIERPGPETRY